jgi:AraC-like DNA-binding protein
MMLHFSSEWFKNKLKTDAHLVDSGFIHFIESKDPLLSLEEKEELTDYFSTKYLNYFQMANSPDKQEKLKQLSKQFFDCFIEKYKCERLEKNHFEINDSSRKSIKQIEKYLMECLPNSFPGIEKISKKMGISPTKLKHDFKIIHQQSIFQFYRQKQMELAYQILSEDKILIKELANQMGYTSIGKFSSAFRNQFGVLPSKALKM